MFLIEIRALFSALVGVGASVGGDPLTHAFSDSGIYDPLLLGV